MALREAVEKLLVPDETFNFDGYSLLPVIAGTYDRRLSDPLSQALQDANICSGVRSRLERVRTGLEGFFAASPENPGMSVADPDISTIDPNLVPTNLARYLEQSIAGFLIGKFGDSEVTRAAVAMILADAYYAVIQPYKDHPYIQPQEVHMDKKLEDGRRESAKAFAWNNVSRFCIRFGDRYRALPQGSTANGLFESLLQEKVTLNPTLPNRVRVAGEAVKNFVTIDVLPYLPQ